MKSDEIAQVAVELMVAPGLLAVLVQKVIDVQLFFKVANVGKMQESIFRSRILVQHQLFVPWIMLFGNTFLHVKTMIEK